MTTLPLGIGYKSSTTHYYHSASQTGFPRENNTKRFHRDTQTIKTRETEIQTFRTVSSQSCVPGYNQSKRNDKIMVPRVYFDSEAWTLQRVEAAVKIQRLYRGFKVRERYEKLRLERDERIRIDLEAIRARERQEKMRKEKEEERKVNPKTWKDFVNCRRSIDSWHANQQDLLGPNPSRKERLDVEKEYISLIQTLSSHKNLKPSITFLQKAANPKQWPTKFGIVEVDTPSTLLSRHLLVLYHALDLNLPPSSRLQVLLSLKNTTANPEIHKLIDREVDLMTRGRDVEGVQARIKTLFRGYCQDVIPDTLEKFKCRLCENYKVFEAFVEEGKCKKCDYGPGDFKSLWMQVKVDEKVKGVEFVMGERDLEYLVDTIWTRRSVISGSSRLERVVLVRWIGSEPLSPWNCVLLTKEEAICHQYQPDGVYGNEFKAKVEQKLALGREHFKDLLGKKIEYANELNKINK